MKGGWTEFRPVLEMGWDHRLARLAGLFPLELRIDGFYTSFIGGLCTVMTLSLAASHLYVCLLLDESPRSFLRRFQAVTAQLLPLSALASLVLRRQAFFRFYSAVLQLEFALFRIGVGVRAGGTSWWTLAGVCLVWAGLGLPAAAGHYPFLLFLRHYWASLAVITCGCFAWSVTALGRLFAGLTAALAARRDPGLLLILSNRAEESWAELEGVYSWSLLIFFISSFLLGLSHLFQAVTSLQHSHVSIIFASLYYLLLFAVIRATAVAKAKADDFNSALYRLFLNDHQRDITVYGPLSKLYVHISKKSSFSFSVGGFFQIDWTLATSIVAATGTYLVLMLQVLIE